MSMYQSITNFPLVSNLTALFTPRAPAQVGDLMEVDTASYGKQTGRVIAITPNPFYGEVGFTAYVGSLDGKPFWTEYVKLNYSPAAPDCYCLDCNTLKTQDRLCPECGMCWSCCDCPPAFEPDEE